MQWPRRTRWKPWGRDPARGLPEQEREGGAMGVDDATEGRWGTRVLDMCHGEGLPSHKRGLESDKMGEGRGRAGPGESGKLYPSSIRGWDAAGAFATSTVEGSSCWCPPVMDMGPDFHMKTHALPTSHPFHASESSQNPRPTSTSGLLQWGTFYSCAAGVTANFLPSYPA